MSKINMAETSMRKLKKIQRSTNWTPDEKEKLIDLIEKEIRIIEDKHTDGNATRRKKRVHSSFTEEHGFREIKKMREMWKRMKDSAKKENSNYQRELKKTGGGERPNDLSEITQRIVDLIPKEFKEYRNPYDDDYVEEIDDNETERPTVDTNAHSLEAEQEIGDDEQLTQKDRVTDELENEENDEDDKGYNTPNELKEPTYSEKSALLEKPVVQTLSTRKRPIEKTSYKKPSPVAAQSKHQKTDIENAILDLSEEEHKLKMDILRTEHNAKMKVIELKHKIAIAKLNELTCNSYENPPSKQSTEKSSRSSTSTSVVQDTNVDKYHSYLDMLNNHSD